MTLLDDIQLDIYNRLSFYLRGMFLYFEIMKIDSLEQNRFEEQLIENLNRNGFCARKKQFSLIDGQEALFQFEWKLNYTEFMNATLLPPNQVKAIMSKTLDNLGQIVYGLTNANIDLNHNEASTRPITCEIPEENVFQNMAIVLVGTENAAILVTKCEY